MNKIIKKILFTGDKFMPELSQDLVIALVDYLLNIVKKIQKFIEAGNVKLYMEIN